MCMDVAHHVGMFTLSFHVCVLDLNLPNSKVKDTFRVSIFSYNNSTVIFDVYA